MTAPSTDFNVLFALASTGVSDAESKEQEAEQLEQRAFDLRMEAAKLRACARTLGRYNNV